MKRRCKQCKTYTSDFIKTPVAVFCGSDCAVKYARTAQSKARERKIKKMNADKVKQQKEAKQKLKARKLAIKPKTKWLSELQSLFNKYVRLRDRHLGCVSCDKPSDWVGQWHASHYFSRGHSSALRFNLWNVHKSCSVCNNHLSANKDVYHPRIIEKIGNDKFDYLVANKSSVADYDIEWIKRAIKVTRKAIKRKSKVI